jgi:DNA-binding PadR family transcriptional regulator
MIKKYKISLSVEKRIILHLAENMKYKDKYEVTDNITQQGIALAVCIRHEHVSRSVLKLQNEDLIFVRSALINEVQRHKKAYFLTQKGLKYANEIKKWFDNKSILIRNYDNELREKKFYEIRKELKLKPLEVYKYIINSKECLLDFNQISLNREI